MMELALRLLLAAFVPRAQAIEEPSCDVVRLLDPQIELRLNGPMTPLFMRRSEARLAVH
jgi:hypothetical protein